MAEVRFTDVVKDLMKSTRATSVSIVSRDGLTLAADVPSGVYTETFAIMCATILGAAVTATSEFNKAPPDRIVVESKDITLIIRSVTKKLMLVISLPSDIKVESISKEIDNAVAALKGPS